jgi:hypothetical protein
LQLRVRKAEMVPDFMHNDMGYNRFQARARSAPFMEQRASKQ